MKKMMYYNMRVRTAQRNLSTTQARLLEQKKTLLQLPEDCIRTLSYALKDVCAILQTLCSYLYFWMSFGCHLKLHYCSLFFIPSWSVNSPSRRPFAGGPPASWRKDRPPRLKVHWMKVKQRQISVRIQSRCTESTERWKH